MTRPLIYLDHNATSPLRPEAREAMIPYVGENYGNPSSQHSLGRTSWNAIEQAREQIASLVDADPEEIIFTSGGTESNHLAILGAVHAAHAAIRPSEAVHKLIVSAVEHPSVHGACGLVSELGIPTQTLQVDTEGRVQPGCLEDAIGDERTVVSIQAANHETGALQDLNDLIAVARKRETVVFHTDAAQMLGKMPFSFAETNADLVTLAPHKFGGPKGVGVLIVRKGIAWTTWMRGTQEAARRGGTPDVAAIVGAGVAAESVARSLLRMEALSALRERLWEGLAGIPGVTRFTPVDRILPNTLMVGFEDWEADRLAAALDRVAVAVSAGSACSSGAGRPSPVLLAMGHDDTHALSGVRFSLGWSTTPEDIDKALARVQESRQVAG